MSKNIYSSDGIAEDMIRTLTQAGCAELHAKTLFDKLNGKLESGKIEDSDINAAVDGLKEFEEMTDSYAELRRGMMRKLQEMYPSGDKEVWCLVKHLSMAMYTAFEAYQASNKDEELLNLYMSANKAFVKALSRFLGTEITECSACFADMLKEMDEENSIVPTEPIMAFDKQLYSEAEAEILNK